MLILLFICIINIILTSCLLSYTKSMHDKYYLIICLIGELILLLGYFNKNNNIIEFCHILYWIIVIYGTFLCKEKYNILFVLLCIILILLTRFYYNDCLFYIANNRTKLFEVTFEIHHLCIFFIVVIIYRLY